METMTCALCARKIAKFDLARLAGVLLDVHCVRCSRPAYRADDGPRRLPA